jgi:hypothetical protein
MILEDNILTTSRYARLKFSGESFPKDHKVQCFRVVVSTHRTDFVVANDLTQTLTEATQQVCGFQNVAQPGSVLKLGEFQRSRVLYKWNGSFS